LEFGVQLGYTGPLTLITSENLKSAMLDPATISAQIATDLASGRLAVVPHPTSPFICSPLGLAPKSDGGLRRIHHLSFPDKHSVNDNIPLDWVSLVYTRMEDVFAMVRRGGRSCTILKWDLRDAFRTIPVAHGQRWLLGLQWEGQYYHETCLPFGLATAPYLFNLFAEGLHWILQAYHGWEELVHYLDDLIAVLPAGVA
jgi:hypothetical protein